MLMAIRLEDFDPFRCLAWGLPRRANYLVAGYEHQYDDKNIDTIDPLFQSEHRGVCHLISHDRAALGAPPRRHIRALLHQHVL